MTGSASARRVTALGLATLTATTAALGVGLPAWAAPPEGTILGVADAKATGYIVVLKDAGATAQSAGTDAAAARAAVSASARTLSARFGGKVTTEYSAALRGFAIGDLSEDQARRLASDPSVAYVQHNSRARKTDTQYNPPWNLDRIDGDNFYTNNREYTYPNTASNVTAYIVDTGISVQHEQFEGRASYGYNAVRDGGAGGSDDPSIANDCDGHGTHVAGTVGSRDYGVAKKIKLVAVRVLDCVGDGTTADILEGIDWVTVHAVKPAVVNMSLGYPHVEKVVDDAIKRSIATGVLWSVSAGNGDKNGNPINACNRTPASVTQALVAGAADNQDWAAHWSNKGPCVDLYAPGYNVTSTFLNGGYEVYSGTSMAAPHVTGAAALILSAHTNYSPGQVHNAVVQSSPNNVVWQAGADTPNKMLKIRQTDPPQVAGKTATLYNPRFGTTEVYARSTDDHLIYAYYSLGWSGWIDLGGDVQGDPSVFYNPGTGSTEVYVRTKTNKVAYRKYVNGWSNWAELGTQAVGGSPQVIYNPRFRTTEIYARTADDKLAFTYFANNSWSGSWTDLGGTLTSDPGLVYNPRFGTTEAYVRNSSGKVEYKYYSNKWSGWTPLEGSIAEGANPVVLFNPRFGTTEVYARGANNALTYNVYVNGWLGWKTPVSGVTLASDPALLYNPRFGSTEVYVRTSDNAVQYIYYLDKWYGWNNLGTSFTGTPALIFNPRWGTTEVYARNNNNGHANYRYYANGWSGWNDISA